jgi:eukaryotic-like serine/threonine-protein kinase
MTDADAPLKNGRLESFGTGVQSASSDPGVTMDSPGHVNPGSTPLPGALPAAESANAGPISIGPYRLIRKLGEGGMGQVWLAEQTAPIQRQVALKLIKIGRYDDSVLQRFYAERQSLAIMDHPSIAKVFDAGATSDGQPYFVMEYVAGQPINEYCDAKRLGIRERLELFVKVCEGVQHAHQKAVIHRDLKPANILVVEVDGKPVPRIIDFGLAKAATPSIGDETLVTQLGGWVGTPGYVSPEQADPSVLDIDTRTDVYSLGAVLYVLLTGFLPFESKNWRKLRFDEFLRQLRDEDPPSPSTKIGTDKEWSRASSEARATEPKQLVSLLHGDLDWITMKALEKDRARRYGTPMELAADIERYLNHEPIVARPASTAYRIQKYVRRHRVGVALAAILVLLLAGFAVMQALQVRRIRAERDRTARERDRANRITDFMQQIFKISDPSESRGNSVTARELLDKASKEIDSGLANDPDAQAQMLQVMGEVYRSLGLYAQAEPLLTRSVEIRQRVLGPNDPTTLDAMSSLALLMHREGREADAEKMQREILETERRVLGPTDARTVASMYQLSQILSERGRYADAEKLQRGALMLEQKIHGPESRQAIMVESNLAFTLEEEGHYKESEALERQAVDAAQRVLGNEHPDTLKFMSRLALVEEKEGRFADEEKLYRQIIDIDGRVLGPAHPQTLEDMEQLTIPLREQHKYKEAEDIGRNVLQEQSRILSPDSRVLLSSKDSLANTFLSENRYKEAETLFRELLDSDRRALGPEHPDTLISMSNLANTLMEEGKYAEAEKLYRQALAIQQRVLPPNHPSAAFTLYNLGCVTAHEGHKTEAISFLRQAVDGNLPAYGDRAMEKDPDLNSLHGDPRFTALVAHAKEVAQAKTAAQKQK